MAIAMLVVGNSSNNGNEVDVQPVEQTPITTVSEAEEDDTASDMLVINGNNGSQVDTQIIEQTPITTNPPTSMLNSTTQSPVRFHFRAVRISFAISSNVKILISSAFFWFDVIIGTSTIQSAVK